MQKTQTKNFRFLGNTFYIRKNMPLITPVRLCAKSLFYFTSASFLPSTSIFVGRVVFFNIDKTHFTYKHPFFGVFVLHSIHCRKIYFTHLTKLHPLFHQLEVLKPLKKPILKSTNHFRSKNPNQKIEVEICQKILIQFTHKITSMYSN